MAWQEVTYRLTSVAPLIVHNGQLANPLNPYTKEMKKVSGKRNKTDADFEQMAKLEFQGGLYFSSDGPVLPPDMLDGMVLGAAKKFKEGPLAKAGCFCVNTPKIEYDGPRDRDGLWNDDQFRFVKGVRVGQSRVMRTRPWFQKWAVEVKFSVESSTINPSRLFEWLTTGGQVIGLGDWRPQYGRFTVEQVG